MVKVTLKNNEPFESLLKRFNNAVHADGVLKDLKERSYYEKPSIKKRRKALELKQERKNCKINL
jgi:small subunit ribosomal protein S21